MSYASSLRSGDFADSPPYASSFSAGVGGIVVIPTGQTQDTYRPAMPISAMIAERTRSWPRTERELRDRCLVRSGIGWRTYARHLEDTGDMNRVGAETHRLCAAYQGGLPGLVGRRSWAPPTSSWDRPADMAVVSRGEPVRFT